LTRAERKELGLLDEPLEVIEGRQGSKVKLKLMKKFGSKEEYRVWREKAERVLMPKGVEERFRERLEVREIEGKIGDVVQVVDGSGVLLLSQDVNFLLSKDVNFLLLSLSSLRFKNSSNLRSRRVFLFWGRGSRYG
jgi:hypothetical protein